MSRKETYNLRRDQAFKELVHDSNILSDLLGGLLPEFEGLTRDEIKMHLHLDRDGRRVIGRETESVSSESGPIFLDSVFDVTVPDSGHPMEVIVAVEGQGPGMAETELMNRELFYSSRLICDQAKGLTKDDVYLSLRKTVAIWVLLSPRVSERSTIVRDYRVRCDILDPGAVRESPLDETEIFEVRVGFVDDVCPPLLRMLNILFSRDMDVKTKEKTLEQKFDIRLKAGLLQEVTRMGALAEEYEIVRNRAERKGMEEGFRKGHEDGFQKGLDRGIQQGIEQGIQQGIQQGIEDGKECERSEMILFFAEEILARSERDGIALEQAAESVCMPESYVGPSISKARQLKGING